MDKAEKLVEFAEEYLGKELYPFQKALIENLFKGEKESNGENKEED